MTQMTERMQFEEGLGSWPLDQPALSWISTALLRFLLFLLLSFREDSLADSM
jgi:hypothetical protein